MKLVGEIFMWYKWYKQYSLYSRYSSDASKTSASATRLSSYLVWYNFVLYYDYTIFREIPKLFQ